MVLQVDQPAADTAPAGATWVLCGNAGPGWVLGDDGATFALPPPTPPGVPASVTMRQARRALLNMGKLAAVDAAIAAMPEPQRSAARIDWEYSTAVERHSALVAGLAPALGLNSAQIDALFVAAAAITTTTEANVNAPAP